MDIIFIKANNEEILKTFKDYDICAKKIFETKGMEQQKYLVLYKKLKLTIDNWVITRVEVTEYLKFKEDEYEYRIHDLVARNLISNGVYNKDEIDSIIKRYNEKIDNYIIEKIFSFYGDYKGKVLVWNIDEEI